MTIFTKFSKYTSNQLWTLQLLLMIISLLFFIMLLNKVILLSSGPILLIIISVPNLQCLVNSKRCKHISKHVAGCLNRIKILISRQL